MVRGFGDYLEESLCKITPPSKERAQIVKAIRLLFTVLIRLCCDMTLLDISQAVGVQDLEDALSVAVGRIGETPATRLVELAIRLDHGQFFPFREVQLLQKTLPADAQLARAIMSDLIVRNTKIFDHQKSTLRRIAGIIHVEPRALLTAGDGSTSNR